MESALNQILNEGTLAQPERKAHSFDRGDVITHHAAQNLNDHQPLARTAYRGLGTDVSMCGNDPQAILKKAGLDWQTRTRTLEFMSEDQPGSHLSIPNMVALVRSDNEAPLAVASRAYKPHHNEQLMKLMCNFADESGLTVARAGLFGMGTTGWVVATSNKNVDLNTKVGDVVSMRIIIRFGHEPGMSTKFQVWCEELRCSNGATVENIMGNATYSHQIGLTEDRLADARTYIENAASAFDGHVGNLARLRRTPSSATLDAFQLTRIFAPDLAREFVENTVADRPELKDADRIIGRKLLIHLLEVESSQDLMAELIANANQRLLNRALDATINQPGADVVSGTMAYAYSGVTNFNSNVRGAKAETGLESNLFGESRKDSQEAMQQAVEFARLMN